MSVGRGLALIGAGTLAYLVPVLAIAAIGLFLSTVTRNSAAAIVGTLMFSLLMQLLGALSGARLPRALPAATQFDAWQGLLRDPADWDPSCARHGCRRVYALPALFAGADGLPAPRRRRRLMPEQVLIVEDDAAVRRMPSAASAPRASTSPPPPTAAPRWRWRRARCPTWSCSTSRCRGLAASTSGGGCARRGSGGVLMLTARDAVEDRVRGLEAGADDYVVKPFAIDEVVARLRALTRRGSDPRSERLAHGEIVLDTATNTGRGRRARAGRAEPPRGRAAGAALARTAHGALTPGAAMDLIWGTAAAVENIVDRYVGRLRRKLGDPEAIRTVRGVGFRLDAP